MTAAFWDGKHWRLTKVPNEVNPQVGGNNLGKVSCTAATACVAVGSYFPGRDSFDFTYGMLARWNGRRWFIQDASRLTSSGLDGLSDVGCTGRNISVSSA